MQRAKPRRQRKKLKKLKKKLEKGEIQIENIKQSQDSWMASMSQCNAHHARRNMTKLYDDLFKEGRKEAENVSDNGICNACFEKHDCEKSVSIKCPNCGAEMDDDEEKNGICDDCLEQISKN